MAFEGLKLPRSRWAGGISEFAVLTPIIPGRVPGERRTYEERLRSVMTSLGERAEAGMPNALSQIPSLHFGRVLIVRPEHYLTHSSLDLKDAYYGDPSAQKAAADQIAGSQDEPARRIPKPLDQYIQFNPTPPPAAPPSPDASPAPDAPPALKVPNADAPQDTPTTPASQNPYGFRSWLATLVIFDSDPQVYLREIATFIENDFDQVFENCEDYPFARNFEKFWAWIRRYQIRTDAFYTPYPNMSVARIKHLEAFKERFDAFVAKVRSPDGNRVEHMDELFDQFLIENQQYASGFPSAGGIYKKPVRAD